MRVCCSITHSSHLCYSNLKRKRIKKTHRGVKENVSFAIIVTCDICCKLWKVKWETHFSNNLKVIRSWKYLIPTGCLRFSDYYPNWGQGNWGVTWDAAGWNNFEFLRGERLAGNTVIFCDSANAFYRGPPQFTGNRPGDIFHKSDPVPSGPLGKVFHPGTGDIDMY